MNRSIGGPLGQPQDRNEEIAYELGWRVESDGWWWSETSNMFVYGGLPDMTAWVRDHRG